MLTEIKLTSSKSLVNRYLILKELHPTLNLEWSTKALDVTLLEKALEVYQLESDLYIGDGGTTLRFLSLFLSTQKGCWIIRGTKTLFKRPQGELIKTLCALGASATLKGEDSLHLSSQGWTTNYVEVETIKTTQVASGLILASLSSGRELIVKIRGLKESSGYLDLTCKFVERLGFKLEWKNNVLKIEGGQKLIGYQEGRVSEIEADWSTAAFLYVLAALTGKVSVEGLFKKSVQPDSRILEILKSSNVDVEGFKVTNKFASKGYKSFDVNLKESPDLFPVLSVFACFCEGDSKIHGAPQLVYKESNRIVETFKLLTSCGYKVELQSGGLLVRGQGLRVLNEDSFDFDVSKDHRMFMACEILRVFGYNINIKGKESINKSFPEYLYIKSKES